MGGAYRGARVPARRAPERVLAGLVDGGAGHARQALKLASCWPEDEGLGFPGHFP